VVEESELEYFVEVTDLCGNTTVTVGAIEPATVSPSIPPVPEFSFEYIDESVQFTPTQATLDIFEEFDWDFGDGDDSEEESPLHTYSPGSYDVRLTAYNEYGCANDFNAIINIVLDLFFYSPDVFSPNGDGVNDSFHVSIVGHESFELFVFDRWGNKLFSTTNPYEGWDGTYPNGNEVPQDVYMYKVVMGNESTGEQIKRGRVSIIK
jgi:gliding motility-associated-like protein